MGAGDVEPVEAVIPEANKTAAQLREEEVERDVEETDRLSVVLNRSSCVCSARTRIRRAR